MEVWATLSLVLKANGRSVWERIVVASRRMDVRFAEFCRGHRRPNGTLMDEEGWIAGNPSVHGQNKEEQ